MKANRALSPMDRVVGRWIVTGSHPMLPGRTLRGEALFERIEDGAFVRLHTKMVDPEIPEGVAIFGTDGDDDACTMLYFDVRGVARRYDVVFHEDGLEWKRDSAEFAQTYRLKITADGKSMEGQGTMKRAGAEWEPDIQLSYRRADS